MQVRSALASRAACASPACGGGGLGGLAGWHHRVPRTGMRRREAMTRTRPNKKAAEQPRTRRRRARARCGLHTHGYVMLAAGWSLASREGVARSARAGAEWREEQGAVGTQGGFTRFSSGEVRRELAQDVQPGRPPRASGGSSGSFLMRFSGPSAPGGSCALFPLLPLAPIVGLIESWCF